MLSFHYLTSMHRKNLKVLCFKTAIWRTLTSSCPIVIFRLTSFRLVRHDRFFFIFVFSLCLLSSKKRLHICLALLGLGNPCKTYEHQSVGKRWNEVLFLCRQSGWHIRARSRS